MHSTRLLRTSAYLYIAALPAHAFPSLGLLQPAELFFIPFFLFSLLYLPLFSRSLWSPMDTAIALFSLCYIAAVLIFPTPFWFKELVTAIYLPLAYFCLSRVIYHFRTDYLPLLKKASFGLLLTATFSGLLGLLLFLTGFPSFLSLTYENYPYFGTIPRLAGFTATPNMLNSMLSIGILIHWFATPKGARTKRFKVFLGLALFVNLLTFSKGLVLFFAAIVILRIYQSKALNYSLKRTLSLGVGVFSMALYVSATLVVFSPTEAKLGAKPNIESRLVKQDDWSNDTLSIYTTVYWYYKKVGVDYIANNFPRGHGAGTFEELVTSYQESGKFPAHLIPGNAHDSYLGIITELGALGLLALFCMLIAIFLFIKHLFHLPVFSGLPVAIAACLIYILALALLTYAWHFRHFFLLLAIANFFLIFRPSNSAS